MACRSLWSPRWSWPRRPCSILRPRDLGPAPLPVEARAYFSQDQLEKAETFRTGQLWLYGATLLIEGGVLILFVRRPPRAAAGRRAAPSGAGRRGRRRGAVGRGRARLAAGERDRAGAGPGRRPGDPGLAGVGRRRRQVAGDRRAVRRRRRRAADRRHAPLRPPLVDTRGGRRGRVRGDHHLRRAGRPRPALQHLQAPAGRPDALRRAHARPPRRASTSARSTRSTPRAARAPPTPTSTGSATPSAWCSTTTC